VSGREKDRKLPYTARARLADNLLLHRNRAGYTQEALGKRAMLAGTRIGELENGDTGLIDTYVRLAGAMSISLNDLLAGVKWVPGDVELTEGSYKVQFDRGPGGST